MICGSIARSFGRKMRVGQLSTMAGAMLLPSMSERDWVAKMTDAFFFPKGLQPLAKLLGEGGVVEDEPPLVDDEQSRAAVEPAFYAVEQVGQHGGRRTGADQPFGLEGLDRRRSRVVRLSASSSRPEATAHAIGL